MATILAFLAPLWASFLAYVAINGFSLAVKVVPAVMLVALVLIEWFTSSVWVHVGFVVFVVLAVVTYLDLAGKLPVLPVPTPTPVPAPKPAVKS